MRVPHLIHLAPEPLAKRIKRNGISAARFEKRFDQGVHRGVFAMPVLESYTLSHQWLRELKRFKARTLVAITFKTADDEPVFSQHFSQPFASMTAREAVAAIRAMSDPRGAEIIVPRRIAPKEIVRIAHVPQHLGWRYFPEVKVADRWPCDCPACAPRGEPKARRYRDRIPELQRRWEERHRT